MINFYCFPPFFWSMANDFFFFLLLRYCVIVAASFLCVAMPANRIRLHLFACFSSLHDLLFQTNCVSKVEFFSVHSFVLLLLFEILHSGTANELEYTLMLNDNVMRGSSRDAMRGIHWMDGKYHV